MADVTKYVDEIAAELSSPLLSFERDALVNIIRRAQDDARAERSSDGEPRGCPTPGACCCPPAEPTPEPSTEPGEEHRGGVLLKLSPGGSVEEAVSAAVDHLVSLRDAGTLTGVAIVTQQRGGAVGTAYQTEEVVALLGGLAWLSNRIMNE